MCVLDCFLKMAVPVPPIPHSQCEFVKWEVCVFIPLTKEDSMLFSINVVQWKSSWANSCCSP